MKMRAIKMSDEEWEKCRRLGGAAWVRAKIKAAKEPYSVWLKLSRQSLRLMARQFRALYLRN